MQEAVDKLNPQEYDVQITINRYGSNGLKEIGKTSSQSVVIQNVLNHQVHSNCLKKVVEGYKEGAT